MTLRTGVLLLAVATSMVSACGGQGSTTPASSPGPLTRVSETGGNKAPLSTDPEAITDYVGFTSPNGNMGCYIDYGQGIDLPVGEMPRFVCAGDSTLGDDKPLAYGKSITVGTLQCASAETGMTCRDEATSHGFSIARERYQLF